MGTSLPNPLMQKISTKKPEQSKNCNMQYETFELGNRQIIVDPEREAEMRKFIDDLGLAGQKQLIIDQDDQIIPFPKMSITDERVWEVVCPEKHKLEDYKDQVIPFEVLELVAMVKGKAYFDIKKEWRDDAEKENRRIIGFIEIWDRPKEQIDPLVVGVIKNEYKSDQYSSWFDKEKPAKYLLARWGHELSPFAEIVKQARDIWTDKRTAEARRTISRAKEAIAEADKAIAGIDADAIDHFGGQTVRSVDRMYF